MGIAGIKPVLQPEWDARTAPAGGKMADLSLKMTNLKSNYAKMIATDPEIQ